MSNWEVVIGLEVHVELNTKTKMFCRCSADYFGKKPNTHTCPVCLGLPGALPYVNREAIKKCIQIGLALNCQITSKSFFERKNYFYPDLAKGYQISQYRWPLCINGHIKVKNRDGEIRNIRINRAHQEEDTGKLTHSGPSTLIDFNRSGVPLVEIVTEPDFRDTTEIKDYARKLQNVFQTLEVSNADMEKGDMRLEANISVRKIGDTKLPDYRVELKNINSFRFMASAVEFEIKRQIEAIEQGEKLHQETRGWNEGKKTTFLQRSKEEANDYRYFPEPDIPNLDQAPIAVEQIKLLLPELHDSREQKYQGYGMSPTSAATISGSYAKSKAFEEAAKLIGDSDLGTFGDFLANKPEGNAVELANKYKEIRKTKSAQITDENQLENVVNKVISQSAKIVADYKTGNQNAIQVLIGQVMKMTHGKADPQTTRRVLLKKLQA